MKKIIAIVLVVVVAAVAVFALTSNKAPETSVTPYEGTLEDLTNALYEANPVEFMAGPAMAIDLADVDGLTYYTGLESADGIAEATWSEAMIGSIPYSLVLVKVAEDADMEAMKDTMFNGINTRKWICVEADQLRVVSAADVIMLVMANSESAAGLADGMVEAFTANVGELSGETLSRG